MVKSGKYFAGGPWAGSSDTKPAAPPREGPERGSLGSNTAVTPASGLAGETQVGSNLVICQKPGRSRVVAITVLWQHSNEQLRVSVEHKYHLLFSFLEISLVIGFLVHNDMHRLRQVPVTVLVT